MMGKGNRIVLKWGLALSIAWCAPATIARAESKEACIAAADAGQQLRDEGKYGEARASFVTCAREACPAVIAKSCMQWQREIDAQMPTIVVAAHEDGGDDFAIARILVDGHVVAEKLDGLPFAVDPGEHVVRVERPAREARETRIVLRAGEKGRAVVFVFTNETSHEVAPKEGAPRVEPTEERSSFWSARNVTVLSFGAAAVLAAGGAIYFGAQSRSEADVAAGYRASNGVSACVQSTSAMCAAWSDAVDAQNRDAIANKLLFAAAGAFSVAAIGTFVLWPGATKSPSASIAPSFAPGYAGLHVGGGF